MIDNEVFRGRFRNSFEKPERVDPGKIYDYAIDIHSANHAFLQGHRIMLQVQSTWFPLIADRRQRAPLRGHPPERPQRVRAGERAAAE